LHLIILSILLNRLINTRVYIKLIKEAYT